MKILLIDRNEEMCNQWELAFNDVPNVRVYQGDFFSEDTDCVVSPANSFGFMDGGLDAAISNKLGWHVQLLLQSRIRTVYGGELLVGQATLIPSNYELIPYLISAPTMRVPMILPKDSVNSYLAAKAIFQIIFDLETMVNNYNIKTITIPGLGTGVGAVPFDICAKQMKQAYLDVYNEKEFPKSWRAAQIDHMKLYTNDKRDIQRGTYQST